MVTTDASCPQCRNVLVGGGDVVQWCPACNWNVDPSPPKSPKSRFGRWWLARQNALAIRLYEDVARRPTARGGGLGIRLAVFAAATAVHLVTLALLAAFVLVAVADAPLSIKVISLVVVGGLLWTVQPVFVKRRMPKGVNLDRTSAPALFALLDEIAAAVGAKPVNRVFASASYNAAYWKDRRRRPIIEIGIPLWVVLSPQERVAVLGHELGHRVNGDLRDLAYVSYAQISLWRWRQLFGQHILHAYRSGDPMYGLVVLAEILLVFLTFPVVALIGGMSMALDLLSSRQGQRAEYLADEIGASVGGSEATEGALTKALLADHLWQQLMRVVRFRRSVNPWQGLRDYLATFPAAERQRVLRVATTRLARIDSSHPPSAFRLKLVAGRPAFPARVAGSSGRMATIDAELDAAAKAAAQRLRDFVGH